MDYLNNAIPNAIELACPILPTHKKSFFQVYSFPLNYSSSLDKNPVVPTVIS